MLRVLAWMAYGAVGLLITFIALMSGHLWFALAVALCFIFGPKFWSSI